MASKKIKYTEIQAGEDLGILADRIYGDPNKYTLLVENNPKLDIFDPKPGSVIKVVNAR